MQPPPWKKTSSGPGVGASVGTYSRAGRPPTGTSAPRRSAGRRRRSSACCDQQPPALRDRQRLGGRLADDPLQPQHQLGVDRQRLPVEDHGPPGEHPLHPRRQRQRRVQHGRLQPLVRRGQAPGPPPGAEPDEDE